MVKISQSICMLVKEKVKYETPTYKPKDKLDRRTSSGSSYAAQWAEVRLSHVRTFVKHKQTTNL